MCQRSLVKNPYGIQINLHVIIFWFGRQYSEPLLWNKLGIRRLLKKKKNQTYTSFDIVKAVLDYLYLFILFIPTLFQKLF